MTENKHDFFYYSPPLDFQIVPLNGCSLLITELDLSKKNGKFMIFKNYKEAVNYKHSISLEQFPDSHITCDLCFLLKEEGGK